MTEKIIIATSLNVADMTEEAKGKLVKQMLGFDLTSDMGKVIGKLIEVEIVNPDTLELKVKAEIHDEAIINDLKNGNIKHWIF